MERRHEIIILAIILLIIAIILILAILFTGFPAAPESSTTMPNVAAEYCTSHNNRYEIRNTTNGTQYGVCILANGTECNEWEFYWNTCAALIRTGEAIPDPSETFCLSKNYTYQTSRGYDGTEDKFCIFPDGKQCDARAFYVGTCNETTAKIL
jgi:putative hemolysin